jgi:tetratricopeptide (TPR) repeat protein
MKRTIASFAILLISFCSLAQSEDFQQAMNMGNEALSARQYAQAIQYFNLAVKLMPDSREAYLKQMQSAILKRDLSVFKNSILKLEELNYPLSLNIYITYSQLAKKQRIYNDGLKMLQKAEEKHNKHKTIFLHRAAIFLKLNNKAEAIKSLNEALTLYPGSSDIIHKLANIYININSPKSISYFKKLLGKEFYKDAALTSLALLYTNLYEENPENNKSDLIQALSYYNQYIQRHPKNQETRAIIENIRIILD